MTSVASAFADLLPGERLLTGADTESWRVAGGRPRAVAFPASDREVAALLGRAGAEGLRVVAAGRGSALAVPGLASPPDLIVSTARMTEITEYEPADLTLTAQGGLTLEALDAATRGNGQWLPLDPPGGPCGTLGALLATASAGPLQAGFGTPRDHVLGLTLVTGEGKVLELGGRVVKNVAGFDLVRLAVGSQGTLGVITRATVRLHPVPEADGALILHGSSLEALASAARCMAQAPVPVAALELAEPSPGADRGAVLAARVVGEKEAVDHSLEVLAGRLDSRGSRESRILWGGEVASLFQRLAGPEEGGLLIRLALAPARLEDLVTAARELVEAWNPGPLNPTFALHATRGRLRVAVPELPSDASVLAGLSGAVSRIREELRTEGGSLRVVAGPPTVMSGPALRSAQEGVGRLLRGIKGAFDPAGVLPPGEVLP